MAGPQVRFKHCQSPHAALEPSGTGMLMSTRLTTMAIWLRIFCAVLLLSLGFGHKPAYAQTAPLSFDTAYVLPDGSFSLLCLAGADEGKPGKTGWHGCEACLIAGGALLPQPPVDHVPALKNFARIDFPASTALAVRHAARPGSPVRGPPSTVA